MKTFKDYYKFPLKVMTGLETVKVITDDNKPSFDWLTSLSMDYINCFIKDINGNKVKEKYGPMNTSYNDGLVYFEDSNNKIYPILRIRGWGMLTDHPYHLSNEEAIRIQDEFGNYIVNQLNK